MTQRRIYQCAFPYFVTFNVLDRDWIFEDNQKAEMLHEIILNAGHLKNHLVYQFCIMPDHVHILCQTPYVSRGFTGDPSRGLENPHSGWGDQIRNITSNVGFPTRDATPNPTRDANCNCGHTHQHTISDFIKSIRGTFSRKIHEGQIWHPRFYDQVIEDEDRIRSTLDYITHNPTKAELPKKYHYYPYQYKDDDLVDQLF